MLVVSDKFGKIAAVGAGSGMTGWMPVFVGGRKGVPQWVLNTAGFAVRTRQPNVLHPSVKSTVDKHELRETFRFVIYSNVVTPSKGANGHSVNAPKHLSSLGVMLFY